MLLHTVELTLLTWLCVWISKNAKHITMQAVSKKKIASRYSNNSVADASELSENIENICGYIKTRFNKILKQNSFYI